MEQHHSKFTCLVCGKEFESLFKMTMHIKKNHCAPPEYYKKYIAKDESLGSCKVCGKPTKFISMNVGFAEFCSRDCKIKPANLDFVAESKRLHGDKYDYSRTVYKGKASKVEIICPVHGVFEQVASDHLRGHGCNACSKAGRGKKSRYTQEEFIRKARMVHGDRYDYSQVEYVRSNQRVHIVCRNHGVFEQAPAQHLRGRGCPKCAIEDRANGLKDTIDQYAEKANRIHGGKYEYLSFITLDSGRKHIKAKCDIHGIFTQDCSGHLSGHGCPRCGYEQLGLDRRLSTQEFIGRAKQVHGDLYDYTKTRYVSALIPVVVTCPTHGDFSIKAAHHTNNGIGCPVCSASGTSKLEKMLCDMFDDLGVTYETRIHLKKAGTNGRYSELDLYLADYALGIEVDGLYWHSELAGKDRNYHLNKTLLCEQNGIQLIHVFQTEFVPFEKLRSRFVHILGLETGKHVAARKCQVREVSTLDKKKFLDENHLQGNGKSQIAFGLYYGSILVAAMTFSRVRVALGYSGMSKDSYEMVRFCVKGGYTVMGAAGKLLSHFETHCNPGVLVTYADRRWTYGQFYKKLGFVQKGEGLPSYWYFSRGDKLYHRFGFRKSVLHKRLPNFDPNLTEWENMQNHGYNRIWDCGTFSFVKTYSYGS